MEVKNDRFTQKHTKVYCEDEWKYNAPHHFNVETAEGNHPLCHIDFQEGPIKEVGVNGVTNEDLLLMVLSRLEAFQHSEYRSDENAEAIQCINEAMYALSKRTISREIREVEGTSAI